MTIRLSFHLLFLRETYVSFLTWILIKNITLYVFIFVYNIKHRNTYAYMLKYLMNSFI